MIWWYSTALPTTGGPDRALAGRPVHLVGVRDAALLDQLFADSNGQPIDAVIHFAGFGRG